MGNVRGWACFRGLCFGSSGTGTLRGWRSGLVALGLLTLAGCSNEPAGGDGGTTAGRATLDPIVVGVSLSLTGNLGPFGQAQQQAIKVAETQINAFGGVLGRRVQFEIRDDGTDTAKSRAVAEELIALGVPIAIGTTGSPQAPDVAPLFQAAKIATISPSASTPVMRTAQPARDRYFFRTAASHGLQAKALALKAVNGIAGAPGCTRLGVVYADDGYGKPIAEGVRAQAQALGAEIVAERGVPTQVKADYAPEVNDVFAARPTCLLVVTFPDVGIGVLREAKKAGRTPAAPAGLQYIGSNGLRNAAGFLVAGRRDPADPTSPTIGEGMVILNFDLNPGTPEYAAFKNIFTSHYPLKPDQPDLVGYTANAYDAAVLAALAIEQAKTTADPVAIRDALYLVSRGGTAFGPDRVSEAISAIKRGADIDYNGASGPVDFDDFGDVLADFVLERVQDGAFTKIDTITVKDLPAD